MTILTAHFQYIWKVSLVASIIVSGLERDGYIVEQVSSSPSGLIIKLRQSETAWIGADQARRARLAAERLWALVVRYVGVSARITIEEEAEQAA